MKPGDYALGSSQSRAAARAMLQERRGVQERLELIVGYDLAEPHATEWHDNGEGELSRIISIPAGMALADGLRALGGFTASELDEIAQAHPEPIDCGSFLALRR